MVIGPAGQLAELLLLICTCVIISDGAVYDADRMQWTLVSVQILLLSHGCEWVNVSSGTGLPGQSRTKGH